jgi:hypothetical protein
MSINIGDVLYADGAFAKQFIYDGSGNLQYEGTAPAGAATSSALWAIRKFNYTGSNVTSITWANGNSYMKNVWDDYAGLTYS